VDGGGRVRRAKKQPEGGTQGKSRTLASAGACTSGIGGVKKHGRSGGKRGGLDGPKGPSDTLTSNALQLRNDPPARLALCKRATYSRPSEKKKAGRKKENPKSAHESPSSEHNLNTTQVSSQSREGGLLHIKTWDWVQGRKEHSCPDQRKIWPSR